MYSILNINSFQTQFVSGLLYSILEGLNPGESLIIKSSHEEESLYDDVVQAKLEDFSFSKPMRNGEYWDTLVTKEVKKSHSTCCGVCGLGD